uniref:Uncharacterized protein n=1 Tax=Palpitomonas bilix TaxID=652834 RepID=A0A7S3D0R3_9EUKA|mmetsp:Transcript_17462/g.43543  ORF Transcript_17462/g.43543 Transcript_17462/m.43543 type:complete len:109 (+) Transcript_17462:58-384(+)
MLARIARGTTAVARQVARRTYVSKAAVEGADKITDWTDVNGHIVDGPSNVFDVEPVKPTGELDASLIGKKQLYLAPGKKTPAEMIAEIPPVVVKERVVGCNGGEEIND